jgi:hypothetical protein
LVAEKHAARYLVITQQIKAEKFNQTHQNFKCKPAIAYAFYVKEKLVCVRLRFVQCPRSSMIRRFHCDIPNDRNSHIRMGFQTKRNNRYANEKDGYYANDLEMEMEKGSLWSKLTLTQTKKKEITLNFQKHDEKAQTECQQIALILPLARFEEKKDSDNPQRSIKCLTRSTDLIRINCI